MHDPQQAEQQANQEAKQQFTVATKILMAILWFFPGVLLGVLIRLFSMPTEFSNLTELLFIYLPWMGGVGLLLAAFGWYFPNLSAWVLELLFGFDFERK